MFDECINCENYNECLENPYTDCEVIYNMNVEMAQYCEMYEQTYNAEDGSM